MGRGGRLPLALCCLAISLAVAPAAGAPPEGEDVEALSQKAKFIFTGTVQKVGAVTMNAVTASENTVVVRVDRVLEAPKALGDYTGKDITVLLSKAGAVKSGQQKVFFTNGWLYGEGLAVKEVGLLDVPKELAPLKEQLAKAGQKVSDKDLAQRLATAELVITGKVLGSKPLAKTEEEAKRPVTEHDPQWQEAEVQVEATEKGKAPGEGKTVTVLFPGSMDVMWVNAPRLKKGDEGVFLLHPRPDVKEAKAGQFTVLESLDFLPKAQQERVRELIKKATPPK
jgi:hypothetical protein